MPALNEKDYAQFNQMLEELEDEVSDMKDVPKSFMTDMIDKNKQYGERMFVSPKQLAWVKKLHEQYVGDTDFEAKDIGADGPGDPRSNRDMDDDSDVPF